MVENEDGETMKVIGLTGGIGSGKSTVSDYLKNKGYYVIDADALAHSVTKKGSRTLDEIVSVFGKEILCNDGELNRKALGKIVFNDKEKLCILERLTTDTVVKRIEEEVNDLRSGNEYDIIFVDAPLLFECNIDKLVDEIWLVNADLEKRIERVSARDCIPIEDILARMNNQMSNKDKALLSHKILDNSNGKEDLYLQIEALIKDYDNTTKEKFFR